MDNYINVLSALNTAEACSSCKGEIEAKIGESLTDKISSLRNMSCQDTIRSFFPGVISDILSSNSLRNLGILIIVIGVFIVGASVFVLQKLNWVKFFIYGLILIGVALIGTGIYFIADKKLQIDMTKKCSELV